MRLGEKPRVEGPRDRALKALLAQPLYRPAMAVLLVLSPKHGSGGPHLTLPVRAFIRDRSHAQAKRVFGDVPFCDEEAFEVFAVQIDCVLAGDAFWRRVLRVRLIDPYFASGDGLALAVGDAPIREDINVGPLS